MLFTTLLVVHAIIAALLVTVILMQKSEGGGLASGGGSPGGLMSARGAADFLTRSTAVLATLFVAMSIALAFVAANRTSSTIDTSLATSPTADSAPLATTPDNAASNMAAPVTDSAQDNGSVPLAQ